MAYHIDLVHNRLEAGETRGQDETSECQSWVTIIPHGEQMVRCISTIDDNHIVTITISLAAILSRPKRCSSDLVIIFGGHIDSGLLIEGIVA